MSWFCSYVTEDHPSHIGHQALVGLPVPCPSLSGKQETGLTLSYAQKFLGSFLQADVVSLRGAHHVGVAGVIQVKDDGISGFQDSVSCKAELGATDTFGDDRVTEQETVVAPLGEVEQHLPQPYDSGFVILFVAI